MSPKQMTPKELADTWRQSRKACDRAKYATSVLEFYNAVDDLKAFADKMRAHHAAVAIEAESQKSIQK